MSTYLLPVVAGAGAGAVVTLPLWWHLRRQRASDEASPNDPVDPWVEAEIDRAAAAWATEHGRPETAGLMADKLRLLHRLGSERERS